MSQLSHDPRQDRRVLAAREFLDAIRPYKVTSRPHSVLVREDAELRRMCGQLLDLIEELSTGSPVSVLAEICQVSAEAIEAGYYDHQAALGLIHALAFEHRFGGEGK